jgi:dCMP deaminase
MIVIGITGTIGAGKGTIVDFLKDRGYKHYSAREFLVNHIQNSGIEVDRDSMTIAANHLRKLNGANFIVKSLLDKAIEMQENCVIESIRNPLEIDYLKQNSKFFLFSVDAKIELRYKRINKRKSATDFVSFETFIENETREFSSLNANNQNLGECIARADYKFMNNGSVETLKKEVEKIITQLEYQYTRPTWDEYFIELANAAARRATCDRGRSGCVIVKDKQVLVTGYVGSPNGLPHCDEVGHLFKQITNEDGTTSNHCVRTVHAEQNAICQAAKRGISLDNSTLYCRMTPCRTCAMLIINCGIKRVVCEKKYHAGAESEELLQQAGIELKYFSQEVLEYRLQ